jgi:hypothetical protein
VIICQNFNLLHIYCIFIEKTHFLKWNISNQSHSIQTWFKLCEMAWFNIPSTFICIKKIKKLRIYLCFWILKYVTFFSQIYFNISFYKINWNDFFYWKNLRLYSNITCKNIVKIFKSLRWDTFKQAHLLKVIQYDISKRSLYCVFTLHFVGFKK